MKVFLKYHERSLPILRFVVQSWVKHGWTPRLIVDRRDTPKRGVIFDSRTVNFGCGPRCARKDRKVGTYGRRGWKFFRLVKFPNGNLDELLNCGRQC